VGPLLAIVLDSCKQLRLVEVNAGAPERNEEPNFLPQ
jgi:hypothetical protein